MRFKLFLVESIGKSGCKCQGILKFAVLSSEGREEPTVDGEDLINSGRKYSSNMEIYEISGDTSYLNSLVGSPTRPSVNKQGIRVNLQPGKIDFLLNKEIFQTVTFQGHSLFLSGEYLLVIAPSLIM